MGDMTHAQRRRIDSAMLESLATSFRMKAKGMPFRHSFNDADVAEMLDRAAELVKPGPRATLRALDGQESDHRALEGDGQ